MSLNIKISAETIFNWAGFDITNSMLISLLVTIFLSFIGYKFYKIFKSGNGKNSGFFIFIQTILESFYEFVQSITPQQAGRFFPIVMTIFLFVIIASWIGLLPGSETIGLIKYVHGEKEFIPLIRGGTADLNITLGLALFAILSVQYFGYKAKGMRYFTKFFDLSNPINFFVSFLELLAEFSRIISFAFRLFGNIFAGEVLLLVIASLIPLAIPLPFLGMEIFVGFIQALVFATLTLVFINIAVSDHH